jgi:hypothetical protein
MYQNYSTALIFKTALKKKKNLVAPFKKEKENIFFYRIRGLDRGSKHTRAIIRRRKVKVR